LIDLSHLEAPVFDGPAARVERGSFRSQGADLAYEIHGAGPPVLAIMGLGCPGAGWGPQIDAMRRHFRFITYDQRGTGATARFMRPITVPQLARDALGLLDHLGIARAHLMGVSMGGMVGLEVAGRWPERFDRLVLGCAPLHANARLRATTLGIARAAGRAFFRGGLVGARDAVKDAWMPLVFNGQLEGDAARFVAEQMVAFDDPTASYGVAAQSSAVFFHDASHWAPRIRSPALVVTGTEDHMIPIELVCRTAEAIPRARLVFLEGAPHGFNLTHAEAFHRLAIEFLTAV
jgi:3-oxoadipate enol-lactonase